MYCAYNPGPYLSERNPVKGPCEKVTVIYRPFVYYE
jgi:hypothetical protein